MVLSRRPAPGRIAIAWLAGAMALAACTGDPGGAAGGDRAGGADGDGLAAPGVPADDEPLVASTVPPTTGPPASTARAPLPTRADGSVVPQTTPEELRDRRLPTVDALAPPPGEDFVATVGEVPADVLARSTWVEGCPVDPDGLAYLTMSFWGFDDRPHTGEMIVDRDVATDIVAVFERLFLARFPIEEMRVVSPDDLAAPPTGDTNNTTSFVCRPVTGGTRFSEHAFGLAVDVNPFHNPYNRGELVLPELAGHYLDRSLGRPGMISEGDVVVDAFASIGWRWGGSWSSLKDYQHFSLNDR